MITEPVSDPASAVGGVVQNLKIALGHANRHHPATSRRRMGAPARLAGLLFPWEPMLADSHHLASGAQSDRRRRGALGATPQRHNCTGRG